MVCPMRFVLAGLSAVLAAVLLFFSHKQAAQASEAGFQKKKVVTVVNRDAVERVAPPPTLRVLQYMPGRWGIGDASGAAVIDGGEELGPVATFMARLSRARRRLQCASDYFEIKWQQGLQQQLGMEGVTGERVFFDPSIPGTTASKLDSMLGSVQHVVESMGPWCGAVCFQELLRSLLSANSQPWYYLQQQQQREQQGGSGPRPPRPRGQACLQEALYSDKMQALVSQVMEAGFDVAEVEREQDAANMSTAEVLAAFGELLLNLPGAQNGADHEPGKMSRERQRAGAGTPGQGGRAGQGTGEHVGSPGKRKEGPPEGEEPHPSKRSKEEDGSPRAVGAGPGSPSGRSSRLQQFHALLEQVQERVRSKQLLQDRPVRAMRLVLGAISPQQLEEAVLGKGGPGEEAVAIPTPLAATPITTSGTPLAASGAAKAEVAQGHGQGQGSPSEDEGMPPIKLLQLTSSPAGAAAPSPSLRPAASPAAPSMPGSGGGSILSMLFSRSPTPVAAVPSTATAMPATPTAALTPVAAGVPAAQPAPVPATRAPAAAPPAVANNGRADMEWQNLLQHQQQPQAQQEQEQDDTVPLVTPKLQALVQQLLLYKDVAQGAGEQGPAPAPWSAIVFVTQRMAACGLHSALKALPCLSFLRTSAIMGAGVRVGEGGYGVKEQSRILKRFRSGELNLLVSTAVAEEGIDVKSCQLVVRFDLPNTAQSYIQSRGRARMHNSELVMMVQRGMAADMQMVRHMVSYEQQLRQEVLLNIERLQAGQLSDDEQDEDEEMSGAQGQELYYEVPSTGARLTLGNAQLVLNNYVTELPADRYMALRPLFRTEQLGPLRYRSRVFLPNNSPLLTADGVTQTGRKLAIAAAALEACRKLHELGALDDHLLPAMAEEPTRQQQQQRRKAVGTDELMENKAHEPPVPVIIQTERPRLMKGKLSSLLGQGQVTLYAYRWVAEGQGPPVPGRPPTLGESSSSLLLGLESLAVVLMGPLPEGLPRCYVHITDPGEERGYRVEQVGLAPAAQLVISQEQLASLLACHGVLLRHMFSKGAYCGASAAAAAARWQQEAAEPRPGSSNSPQGRAGAAGSREVAAPQARPGDCSAGTAADASAAAVAEAHPASDGAQQAQPMQADTPPAAASGEPGLVRQLVLDVFNRVVLLHDGVPLLPRREELALPKPEDTSFLLAPCLPGMTGDGCVDWAGVRGIVEADAYEGSALGLLQSGGPEALAGRVVVTEYNRVPYVARGLAQDVHVSSRFPAAQPAWRSRRVRTPDTERPTSPEMQSYAKYYATRWGRGGLCPDQPLLRAERMPRKQLLPTSGLGGKPPKKKAAGEGEAMAMLEEVQLVPELCLVCPVPSPLWEPLAALPRLMWHTEAAIQAAALKERITPAGLPPERSPSLALIRTALTAKSALEGADYERLETLGDGFIKYAVSVQLFATHSTFHEGQLTKRKDGMVANRRLAEHAQRLGLDRCVRLHPFSMSGWLDPQPDLRSDKVLADGLEALVGAFFVAGGELAARAFLQHLGIIPPWKTVSATEMTQEPAKGEGEGEENCPPGSGLESCTDFDSLEGILRYKFRCRRLVEEALTHCSWPGSGSACYQRLEFLGDAVLDVAVTRHFFTSFREATPSKLHDMRSVTVNAERLALVVVRAGIHRHIRHQSPRLFQHIEQFVGQWNDEVATAMEKLSGDHQAPVLLPPPMQLRHRPPAASPPHVQQAAHSHPHHHSPSAGPSPLPGRPRARNGTPPHQQQYQLQHQQRQRQQQSPAAKSNADADEAAQRAQYELRERAEQEVMRICAFGFEHVQAPKVLSDVLEALLGAIYIDSGGDLETVWRVVQRLLHPLVTPSTVPVQPVRHIQEMVQRYSILPEYEELGRDLDSGAVHVRVSAAGVVLGESFEAGNFRTACRLAAKDAVGRWKAVRRELEAMLEVQRAERKRKRQEEKAHEATLEVAYEKEGSETPAGEGAKEEREEGREEGLAWQRRRREGEVGDSAGVQIEGRETA